MEILCRDFERMWNELFDARSSLSGRPMSGAAGKAASQASEPEAMVSGRERALLDHAAGCPACGRIAVRYQRLDQALQHWGPPPTASASLTDRILAAIPTDTMARTRPATATTPARRAWRAGPLTAAAAILVAMTLGLLSRAMLESPRQPHPDAPIVHFPARSRDPFADGRMFNTALADATDATWDLARLASEPAARISRQVLEAATSPERPQISEAGSAKGAAPDSVTALSLGALAPDSAAAVASLQQVGDHLASGVKPLSTTARQAFSFLLVPARDKAETRARPAGARGA
jgi:hypothetical protein